MGKGEILLKLQINRHVFVNFREFREERLAQEAQLGDGVDAHHLAARVHRQLRNADIDDSHAQIGRSNRANSRATGGVISDHNILNSNASFISKLMEKGSSDCRCSITLKSDLETYMENFRVNS